MSKTQTVPRPYIKWLCVCATINSFMLLLATYYFVTSTVTLKAFIISIISWIISDLLCSKAKNTRLRMGYNAKQHHSLTQREHLPI